MSSSSQGETLPRVTLLPGASPECRQERAEKQSPAELEGTRKAPSWRAPWQGWGWTRAPRRAPVRALTRADRGARPEGPEVVLTAPHLAGDTRIVREIVGKLDERTLGMGGALFSAEGGCALRRGSRQARRSCWAAGSRPRCPRAPRPWRRTRGLLRIRCSACGDAAFSSPLRRPCGVLFCSSKPSAHFPLAGVWGWRGESEATRCAWILG